MRLANGALFGGYQIIERLGAGGMATVYKAHQPKLERDVAIKIMHDSIAQDANFQARFEREDRIVAKLDHPHIVPIYDYDDQDGRAYLVMKFIEGVTLKDLLARGALPTADTLRIAGQVAEALSYAHEQGILHRDIKPSNIMIDGRGFPYLTDFGLARIARAGESTMSAEMMLGTPHYISPEQAQGKNDLDARTDVYSLGVVIYEMLTGRVPFMGDTSYAIIHDQIYTPPPSPLLFNASLPEAVETVLFQALAKNPADRYATPAQLIAALRQALSGELPADPAPMRRAAPQPTPAAPRPPMPPSPPWASPPPWARRSADESSGAPSSGWSRWSWRPGTTWTEDIYGNHGFFTPEELRQQEQSLTEEERIRLRVKKRIDERNGLYGHLAAYISVNLMLWVIWAATDGGDPWPIYPTLSWGIGMVFHFMGYYAEYGAGARRQEQEIQREIERERQRLADHKLKNDDLEGRQMRLTGAVS